MERGIIWYVLSLKNNLKKRSSYLTVLGMLFLILILSSISIPNATNMKAGLFCGNSEIAHEIKEQLEAEREDFEFVEYDEADELIEDVVSGAVDCGFVFSEDFDEMFEERDTEEGITYYATTFSTKGEVLKETLFSAYFELYSQNILEDAEEEVFGNKDEQRMEEIVNSYQLYLDGNEIFQIEIGMVEDTDALQTQNNESNPVKGIVGLTIFLVMFFAYGETQLRDGDNVELALNRKEQLGYRYIKMLAAATLPFVIGFVLILLLGQPEGLFIEFFRLILFILLSGLWMLLVARALGKAEDLPTWLLSIILLHLLICPIFYDFSIYVPAIKWLRYALPLGIYFAI